MRQYMIKFELIDPRSKKIYNEETKLYKTEKDAYDEYYQEARKRTQMGLMKMLVAELLEFRNQSSKTFNTTTIVDWREDN